MKNWIITAEGTVTEKYEVTAKTLRDARDKFERGEVTKPFLSEVNNSEILFIDLLTS